MPLLYFMGKIAVAAMARSWKSPTLRPLGAIAPPLQRPILGRHLVVTGHLTVCGHNKWDPRSQGWHKGH